ncbi:hypothetical protein [Phormidium tenue]|uniref:VWFA domain-containing protein n=1 Tax=Phormidium tenue NIES-30 TaxID=549789 RepID=A0A1U7J7P8_9CYAN|nr:hypothetical protein [Phormidium tenue]MBD2231485.1 hypothetical protein [Phormidium tenue FACHB-1052]OKH49123.1 hypothetical protein NIES30_08140 [Phormidium tenue NIES-30]
MNNSIAAAFGVGILAVALLAQISNQKKADLLMTTTLYVVIDCSTQEELQYGQVFLEKLYQKMPRYHGLIVDVMYGDGLSNRYSDRMSKKAIEEVYSSLILTNAGSQAFVQAIHRTELLAAEKTKSEEALHTVVLSQGLDDEMQLPSLESEIRALTGYNNFKLYIVGLEANTSLKLSSSFNPIQEHIEFSGTLPSELQEIIHDLGEEQQ